MSANCRAQQLASLVDHVTGRSVASRPPRPLSASRGTLRAPAGAEPVAFESALERDFLVFCRTEPRVKEVRAQQLQIHYWDRKRQTHRRYTPDFVVEFDGGAGLTSAIVEVKRSQDLWRSRCQMRCAYAAARVWAAGQPNTIFRVVTDRLMAGNWIINARLLSASLDRACDVAAISACSELFASGEPRQLGAVLLQARELGLNPDTILGAVYRMVALGQLDLDRGHPITMTTWVTRHEAPK
ncbi:TnsA endonuclease N-terminal domain-containing protein [Caulobacter sp.]